MEGLKRVVANNGIPFSEEIQKVEEGWEGKAKGLFEVLWERGFLNSENIPKSLKDYTLKGRKDQYGIINVRFSLTHLMSTCTDFEEEKMILQTMGRQMGVEVDRTPKCHPELVGEGFVLVKAYLKKY